MISKLKYLILLLAVSFVFNAQESGSNDVEEVVTVGTQIKGAKINEALPVTVISAQDIEDLGVDSGDDLLSSLPEQGINQFGETGDTGGINGARGDVGSFDIRSLGTGNTLVLLNGRRMVSGASYQTEEIGGSFVPVESPNTQVLPLGLIERVEILRDGAAALYGSDAVAAVVNNVLDASFQGFEMRVRYKNFEHYDRDDHTVTIKWGESFNSGRTQVSTYASFYDRDRIRSVEDEVMGFCDRNVFDASLGGRTDCSSNSAWGQFDMSGRASYTDSSGEFLIYPATDPRCLLQLGDGVCAASDSSGNINYNWYADKDYLGALERRNVFTFLNHDLGNSSEMYMEFGYYDSDYSARREQASALSAQKFIVPASHPNNFTGKTLQLDNYRFNDFGPRETTSQKTNLRMLLGFRGELTSGWDWDSAYVFNEELSDNTIYNRINATIMDELLQAGLYNPFNGGGYLGRLDSDGDPTAWGDWTPGAPESIMDLARIDVIRNNGRTLQTFDFKLSRPDLFSLPGGDVSALIGFEWRGDSFFDDRDDNLDGTNVYVRRASNGRLSSNPSYTYPYISNVVGSSPTPDNNGDRTVNSVFVELGVPVVGPEMNVPLVQAFDLQVAWRNEAYSDFEGEDVSRYAFGWRVADGILFRGSSQETFRAPNLYTMNELTVSRVNTRWDWAAKYVDLAATAAGLGSSTLWDSDGRYGVIRNTIGSRDLLAELATNETVGVVLEYDNFVITYDLWEVSSDRTVGLLGEENSMLIDLVRRLQGNCDGYAGVRRVDPDPGEVATMEAIGFPCPFGQAESVFNQYVNLGPRSVAGWDGAFIYDLDFDWGSMELKHLVSFTREKEQAKGGLVDEVDAAYASGLIDETVYPLVGLGNLLKIEQAPKRKTKSTVRFRWNSYALGFTHTTRSEVLEPDVGLRPVGAASRTNAYFDYNFSLNDNDARMRFGVNNLHDRRPPLADYRYGFLGDLDIGTRRDFYFDFRVRY